MIEDKILKSIKTLVWRRHAIIEAENDNISESNYPDDQYGESALVLTHVDKEPVHVVLSPREDFCYIITVYIPNKNRWNSEFMRRK